MTFEEQMDIIIEQWEKHPIPEDFQNTEHNKNMCSIEGIQKQQSETIDCPVKNF